MSTPDTAVNSPDRQLAERILAGDRRAYDEFTDDYLPQLYRFAARRLRDREATREVVQSTLCKALTKLHLFRGEAALMTWLCAICRNEIAGHFKQQGRRRMETEFDGAEQTDGVLSVRSGIDGPERTARRRETAAQVHDALDALPPKYALALELKYLQDFPVKEIARRLGVSAKAAESLLTRARSAFRDLYGEAVPPSVGVAPTATASAAVPTTISRGRS